MVKNLHGKMPTQAFLKVPFWDIFLFLIYINDLSGDLSSKAKLFPDDTSLFNVAHDINTSANELNNDLKVRNWVFQWKMSFNPHPSKQAQEVIFSQKLKKKTIQPISINIFYRPPNANTCLETFFNT